MVIFLIKQDFLVNHVCLTFSPLKVFCCKRRVGPEVTDENSD